MRVDVHYPSNRRDQVQVLQRCAPDITAAGVDLRFRPDEVPDARGDGPLFLHGLMATPEVLHHCGERRVIVLERSDSAELLFPWVAAHPSVVAIVKHAHLRHDLLAGALRRGWAADVPGAPAPPPRDGVSVGHARKAVSALTFGQYARMRECYGQNWFSEDDRPIDVFFAGQLCNPGTPTHAHRVLCVEAIGSLPERLTTICLTDRPLAGDTYLATARHSKIMVSPWGRGELCYRDYEAMASGAVLIKPASDHVITNIGMFRAGETYFPCKADFSDLAAVVADVLAHWPALAAMRSRNWAMVVEQWQPQYVAREVTQIVERASERREAVAWA